MKDLKTMRTGRVIVLCDFDGTITPDDTTDGILATCAYPEWKEIEDQWEAHEISTQDCMEQQTLCIRARSRRKLLSYLERVNIDPLFPSFVEFCRENDLSLIVQSDGYDLAICGPPSVA
jgi:2-hydroxy-3-keto-5-methylthiopentenyl-1-phosphate phosphatase